MLKALPILALILATPLVASATPFVVTAELTGDGRVTNPDGINVDVTITGDTTSDVTNWVVDLDMAAIYPDAALHEFYVNLLGDSGDYLFFGFNPDTWSVTDVDGTNAQGSGNVNYMFELAGPNSTVTNTVNLTFSVQKLTGDFTIEDLLDAMAQCSNDAAVGCGQLGAHVGSIGVRAGQSGFAMGDYFYDPDRDPQAVPEPMSLTLLGSGLVALAARARRRRQK